MVQNEFAEVETSDIVASGGSDSSAQVLRNSRPEFRPPAASTYGFITELLYFDFAQSHISSRLVMSFVSETLTVTTNMSLQSPDGGAAMGGIAAQGGGEG
ncbi:MAG: hypothetical protein SOR84_05545 [Candidatus Cryptobacteroides sp.]|nr:hypothetical protein [Candidatus Cryptobacteroides sp.]